MKTTKLKMHPGKAAKKVAMQRLYGQMATETGEGRKIEIEERNRRFSCQEAGNGPRAHWYLRRRKEIQKRTGREGRKV